MCSTTYQRSLIHSVIFLLGLFWVGSAGAGIITLRTQMTLSVVGETIKVTVNATNTGTEAAQKVSAVLHILDRTFRSDTVASIAIQKTHSFHFNIRIPGGKQGRFPFVGEVFFHDKNLNIYSALSAGIFLLNNRYPASLTGRASSLDLTENGMLTATITNRLPDSQPVVASLYLPHALSTSQKRTTMDLAANDKRTLSVELTNHSGSGGAQYPLFWVFESDPREEHNTILVRTTVRIKEPTNWFVQTRWYWLGGLGVLLLIWGGIGIGRLVKGIGQRAWSRGKRA